MLKGKFNSCPFLLVGHRGSPLRSTENTMPSFQRAVEARASAVEFDIRLSKDQKVFIFHDDRLNRLTLARGFFKNWSSEDLKKVQFNNGLKDAAFLKIPTLEQVLKKFGKKLFFYIELKVRGYSKKSKIRLAEETMRILAKMKLIQKTILVSFDYEIVKWIKKKDHRFFTGLNFDHVSDLKKPRKDCFRFLDCLCPRFSCLNDQLMAEARSYALDVLVWVVNDLALIKKVLRLGVRGVATDNPEKMRNYLLSIESKILQYKGRKY